MTQSQYRAFLCLPVTHCRALSDFTFTPLLGRAASSSIDPAICGMHQTARPTQPDIETFFRQDPMCAAQRAQGADPKKISKSSMMVFKNALLWSLSAGNKSHKILYKCHFARRSIQV
jgi:hypothetical protein